MVDWAVVGREKESRWCSRGGGARGGEDRVESIVFERGRIELIMVLVPEISGGEVDVRTLSASTAEET
jgi:hypothetical protein